LCVLALATLACGRSAGDETAGASGRRTELIVFAAASTRDALQKIESGYERDHNIDIVYSFGSSGNLARQILASPKADVFLSADEIEMMRLDSAGLIISATRRDLLSNQLVVIEPSDVQSIFAEPFTVSQLSGPRVRRLSLANTASVPAGRYAKAWLEQHQVWDELENRVIPATDVRAALAAVESGGADAGIVYSSDVAPSRKARVVYSVPPGEGPRIVYPVAVISGTAAEVHARAFVDYLASPAARTVFEESGFLFIAKQPPDR
jgi:molybdate transport system substrate-binding protein